MRVPLQTAVASWAPSLNIIIITVILNGNSIGALSAKLNISSRNQKPSFEAIFVRILQVKILIIFSRFP